jgi:hypothetical protein
MDNVQSLGFRDPADRTAANLGGQMAVMFGQKFNPAGFTPADKAMMKIKDRANSLFTESLAKANTDGATLDDSDKALLYQKAAAQANLEAGDVERYHNLMLDVTQKQLARDTQKANLDILEANVARVPHVRLMDSIEEIKAQTGASIPVFLPDESGHYNFDSDPVIGQVGPDGTMTVRQNDGSEQKVHQWLPYNDILKLMALNKKGQSNPDTFMKNIGQTGRDKARDAGRVALAQNRIVGKIADAFEGVATEGQNPDVIMGTPGSILSFVDKVRAGVKAGFQWIAPIQDQNGATISVGDFSNQGQIDNLVRSSPLVKQAYDNIKLPKGITGSEQEAAYKSAVVQLAYATAVAAQGGVRSGLSDKDFANGLTMIGASSGNARNMMLTVLSQLDNGMSSFNDLVDQFHGVGQAYEMTPDEVDAKIFGNVNSKLTSEHAALRSRIQKITSDLSMNVTPEEAATGRPSTPAPAAAGQEIEYVRDANGRLVRK